MIVKNKYRIFPFDLIINTVQYIFFSPLRRFNDDVLVDIKKKSKLRLTLILWFYLSTVLVIIETILLFIKIWHFSTFYL